MADDSFGDFMNHRAKPAFLIIALAITIVIALVLWRLGNKGHKAQIGAADIPCVTGAWFVQYLSDPNPYLDVEIAGMDASKLLRVTADLTGPQRTFFDIALSYNPKDGEWQKVCDFLDQKLSGGLWWVSRIEAIAKSGKRCEYVAENPQGRYLSQCVSSDGTEYDLTENHLLIGAFYATEKDESIYRITTYPLDGEEPIDPIMYVYRADDPKHWFALSDDPDVEEIYPKIALPLTPGEDYLIRVLSLRGDAGSYGIFISGKDFETESVKKVQSPDSYEPDNTFQQAKPITLLEAQSRTLSPFDGAMADVDWIRFTAGDKDDS